MVISELTFTAVPAFILTAPSAAHPHMHSPLALRTGTAAVKELARTSFSLEPARLCSCSGCWKSEETGQRAVHTRSAHRSAQTRLACLLPLSLSRVASRACRSCACGCRTVVQTANRVQSRACSYSTDRNHTSLFRVLSSFLSLVHTTSHTDTSHETQTAGNTQGRHAGDRVRVRDQGQSSSLKHPCHPK